MGAADVNATASLRSVESEIGGAGTHIQHVVASCGVEAWLVEEYAVPIVALEASFRGGSAQDPASRPGLATIFAGLLDEGAGPYDASGFQERLDDLAIELNVRAGRDALSATLKTLAKHKDAAFEMLRLALREAHLADDALQRVRGQVTASLRREVNEPNAIANKAWLAAAFPDHPYGRPENGTLEGVQAIARDDLLAFRAATLARSDVTIAVVGAIDAGSLARAIDHVFGTLPDAAQLLDVPLCVAAGTGTISVHTLDIPQSTIRYGAPGLRRTDPDFIPATIGNHILGGGSFTSRLWQEVREKRGMAYSVSTSLQAYASTGFLFGGTATKNERAKEALDIIQDEIRRFAAEGPTGEELDKAKRYLTGSYALRFDTSPKIASQLVQIQIDKLGIDYIGRRNALFDAVTLDDVQRASRRWLGSGELLVSIAGRPDGL